MRLDVVREVFLKELRETMRDRRSVAVMFGIPLLLYPILTLSTASLGVRTQQRMSRQVHTVMVLNPEAAPHLLRQMGRPESGVRVAPPGDTRAALAAKQVDAVIIVPPRFEALALAAKEAALRVQLDRSRSGAPFTQRAIDRILEEYERWIIRRRLEARGMPATLVRPLRTETEDVATGDRRLGTILARMLPAMLLITGALGAFYPAVNAAAAERELGTLETLLVTPAGKLELLLGKAALVLLSGLLTAGLNLLSMSLVIWRTFTAATGPNALALNPAALGLTYLAAVPAIIFCAAACLVVSLMARSFKEANSYSTPVMLLSMAPMFVGIADPKTTAGLLVMPLVNTTLVIRDVLAGDASAGGFLLAFGSSFLYAGLMLSLAARLFTAEQLVNPAWEPLSLRGLRRGSGPRPRRLPAVDEALTLYAVALVLLFYVSPAWQQAGLLPALAGNELLLIAAPALLAAWLGRYRWRETFSWRKPSAAQMAGGALIGLGLVPWVNALLALQNHFWPMDPAVTRAMAKAFLPALQQHPVLTVVAVGVLAGVCEELLYRGPIQAALTRRLPVGVALLLGGFMFALAHLYVQGLPLITLIGMILGWIVLRTGSIFPAMLAHGLYDSAKLAIAAWSVHAWGPERAMELATRPDAGLSSPWMLQVAAVALAAGAVALLLGWRLLEPGPARALVTDPGPART